MLQTKEREGNASVLWCKKSFLPSSFCVTVWYDRSGADIAEEMKTNWFAAALTTAAVSRLYICTFVPAATCFFRPTAFTFPKGKKFF